MKETINFVFNENEVPNRATAHSLTTGEKQIVSKDLVLEKLTSLKKDFSNVSCRTRKGEVSSTFVFKYKKNNQELLARVILNNNDPFYESVSNLSELYKVNKKYKKLKTLAIASGIVLVTTAPIVQKNITNFTNKVISKHNVEYEQQNDLNKLDSLVTRLSLNGLTREEYYELRDLMSKYKNQINQQESINYEKIIDENESKIR
mgnify:FL=1